MRQKAHGIWVCELFLSRPVTLTARMENKNRRGGYCHGMQGRAKPLSLPEWTRTLLSPAIRRSPMSAAVSQMWRTSCPVTTLINAVCFAWPATTLAAMRYASRLMKRKIIDWGNGCQARVRSGAGITGTGGERSGLTGTARDEWQELFFLDGRYIFATLPAAVAPLTYDLVALVSRAFSASTDIAGLSR